ncbi:MAG: fructosamine kinase family protein [Clostridia bacterium]|nr:fructosamine kinase family protein [Clostridia bacterium]
MIVDRVEAIKLDRSVADKYIRVVIKEQFDKNIQSINYLGGGSFGSAFNVEFEDNSNIVVKFLRAKDMLEKEVYDLGLLGASCSLKFPKVLFVHRANESVPIDCYGMDMIKGKSVGMSLGMLFQPTKKRKAFADKVTTALHEIHQVTNEKFGDTLSPEYTDWLDFYKPFAKAILDKAEEMYKDNIISKKIIMAMRTAWDKFDIIFSEKVEKACLIHGDLNVGNIMVDKKYNITGFIDPLNSMYADLEYDLFQFDNITGKKFYLRRTYIEKYGASKNCDVKCAFYGLYNEVYCFIKSGLLVDFIMNPLIKNMYKRLAEL